LARQELPKSSVRLAQSVWKKVWKKGRKFYQLAIYKEMVITWQVQSLREPMKFQNIIESSSHVDLAILMPVEGKKKKKKKRGKTSWKGARAVLIVMNIY
jgi:hypothetical protein